VTASELRAALKLVRERCTTAAPVSLTWGPVAFELLSPVPVHHDWFRAYLHTGDPGRALPERHRHRLYAVEDAALFERLVAQVEGLPEAEAVAEDYTGRLYRHGHADECTYWLTHDPADNLGENNPYLILHDDEGWHVVAPPTPAAARNPTLVARELLRWHLQVAGGLVVHASAASYGGQGMLFSGDAGTGKTTLALAAAQRAGRFVSGDRTALLPMPGELAAAGIALASRVRSGTLAGLGIGPRLGGRTPLRELPGKWLLTQTDLEDLAGIGTAAAVPLSVAVFTVRCGDGDPLSLDELTAEQARELLDHQVLGYDNEWPVRWLMAGLGCADPPAKERRHEAVLAGLRRLRLLQLSWNPNRHNVAAALDELARATGPRQIRHGRGSQ
jgi:hypothetical protein